MSGPSDERAAFEAWARMMAISVRRVHGDYEDMDARNAWYAWRASRRAALEEAAKDIRQLRECVADMCALLDVAGERADLGPVEGGAWDYFAAVSKNLGMARLVICQGDPTMADYYDARVSHYKAECAAAVRALER